MYKPTDFSFNANNAGVGALNLNYAPEAPVEQSTYGEYSALSGNDINFGIAHKGGSAPANAGGSGFSWFNQYGADGEQTQQGVLAPILGGIQSAANIYLGLKNLGLQEDQFKFNKRAYTEGRDAQYKDYDNRQSSAASRRAGALSNEALDIASFGGNRQAAEAAYVSAEVNKNTLKG